MAQITRNKIGSRRETKPLAVGASTHVLHDCHHELYEKLVLIIEDNDYRFRMTLERDEVERLRRILR